MTTAQIILANKYIQLYREDSLLNAKKMQYLELSMDQQVVDYIESILGKFCFS